jgi:hypothetical protein
MVLEVVPTPTLPDPPYPADIRARGWHFMVDMERVTQSQTWLRAPADLRPWLLMLWACSWTQSPCGTLPSDDDSIAAIIGMPVAVFQVHRLILLRGWVRHVDNLLYHRVVTENVWQMMGKRKRDAERVAERRKALNSKESHGVARSRSESAAGSGSGVDLNQHPRTRAKPVDKSKPPATSKADIAPATPNTALQKANGERQQHPALPVLPDRWWTSNQGIDRACSVLGVIPSSYASYDDARRQCFDRIAVMRRGTPTDPPLPSRS